MSLLRPHPVLRHSADPVDRRTPPTVAAQRLLEGKRLVVRDHYSTGAEILLALRERLGPPAEGAGYPERRAFQERLEAAAPRLLAPVVDHRLALSGARECGFLADLYPELPRFSLPLLRLQELHGAWERYQQGVHFAVLGRRIHPFYGTYAPTRTEHMELFATWLSGYRGPRGRAVDVGTGCGVLALMLARAGFAQVRATDNNPNAVESVRRELARAEERQGQAPAVAPVCCDLLGDGATADLIVFNPPWMQGAPLGLIDRALYFEPGLFERFFDQAAGRLAPEGRIAMVFSSVLQLVKPDLPHPIEAELARGRLRLVQKLHRRVKSRGRRRTRERVEIWELALNS
jgi:predicted RNA methylase